MNENTLIRNNYYNLININDIPDLQYEMSLKDILEDLLYFPENVNNIYIKERLKYFIIELK